MSSIQKSSRDNSDLIHPIYRPAIILAVATIAISTLAIGLWLSPVKLTAKVTLLSGWTFIIGSVVIPVSLYFYTQEKKKQEAIAKQTVGKTASKIEQVAAHLKIDYPAFKPQTSYPIDQQKVSNFVKTFSTCKEDKKVFIGLINNMQHITYGELYQSFATCIQTLNQEIAEKRIEKYAVAFTKGKSSEWLTGIALDRLDLLPSEKFDLHADFNTVKITSIENPNYNISAKTVVLFDDCVFSGSQLFGYLWSLNKNLPRVLLRKYKIYLVIPFVTETFIKTLNKHISEKQYPKLTIELITSKNRIQLFNRLYNESEQKKIFEVFQRTRTSFQPAPTLCYCDWRHPDAASTFPLARLYQNHSNFRPAVRIGKERALIPMEYLKYSDSNLLKIKKRPDFLFLEDGRKIPFPDDLEIIDGYLEDDKICMAPIKKEEHQFIPPILRPYGVKVDGEFQTT